MPTKDQPFRSVSLPTAMVDEIEAESKIKESLVGGKWSSADVLAVAWNFYMQRRDLPQNAKTAIKGENGHDR